MTLSDEFDIETFREGNRFEAKLAKGGIPDVFSVWNKEFGFVPEYEQKISPERTVTILRLSGNISRTNVQDVLENVISSDKTDDKSSFQAIKQAINLICRLKRQKQRFLNI